MDGVRETPVGRVLLAMHALLGREAEAAATEIDAILRRSPVRLVPALDRALRDEGTHSALGIRFIELRPEQVERLARFEGRASALLGVASLVRDGHARQAAVQGLADRYDRLATAFLVNRINDYVKPVVELAWAALERRQLPQFAGLLVASLPLIDRMREWTRAGLAGQERLRGFLRSPHPAVREAVWAGLTATDREVVMGAVRVLAEVHRGQPEMERVLAAALAVRDPQMRRWAAVAAGTEEWTPPAVFHALAPRLAVDRTPAIRLIGLRGVAETGDRAAIERATLDTNAEVRHQARVLLATKFSPLDYRAAARAMLAEEGAERSRVIAALALLSEFGRAEDRELVLRFVGDPRASVAREGRRTLSRLP